jgi:hypothetical protein
MGKHPGFPARKTAEPILRSAAMTPEPLVFPPGPPDQQDVEMAENRIQRGLVEPAVVLNPAAQDWIPHAREVIDGLVAPRVESPAPHRLPHRRRRRTADAWSEVDEALAPSILRPSSAKRVAQEIKAFVGRPVSSVVILAIDDARLHRMHFQATLREPTPNARQHVLRLRFRFAVRDNVVCISLERDVWVRASHPVVEREMQKDIGQQRTDHSPNAKGNFQFERVIEGWRLREVLDLRRK